MDPPGLPGKRGGLSAGAGDRSGPTGRPRFISEMRPKLKKAEGCLGRAARRRMLTPMRLTVASADPSITRRREPSLPRPPRLLPGLPGPLLGARTRGPVLPVLSRVPQSRETKHGPFPGAGDRGRESANPLSGFGPTAGVLRPGAESSLSSEAGRARGWATSNLSGAQQPFRMSRYKGTVVTRLRMCHARCGSREGRTLGGTEGQREQPVCPPVPRRAGPWCACPWCAQAGGERALPWPFGGAEKRG